MTLSISQLAGPLFLLLGLAFLLQKSFYVDLFKGMAKDKTFLFLDGVAETLLGLIMVLNHNVWNTTPEIVVSLLGWAVLVEGVLVLLAGKVYVKGILGLFSKDVDSMVVWSGLFLLVVGVYLSWLGYLMVL